MVGELGIEPRLMPYQSIVQNHYTILQYPTKVTILLLPACKTGARPTALR